MASATPKNAPYRPKSPEHFKSLSTRCREKEELQDLNERLLVYVNHMRSLKEIEETETHVQIDEELNKVQESLRGLFESELSEARRLLDETANAKAQLELENGRNLDTIAQLKAELNEKDKEIAKLLKKIEDLENKLNRAIGDNKELRSQNKQLQKENDDLRKQLENEINNRKQSDKEIVRLERVVTNYENDIIRLKNQLKEFADKEKDLKNEIKNLKKALEDLKDELDKETLKRIDMENKNQTLKEELEFKDSLKDRELSELRREMSSTHRIKIKKKEAAEEFALQLSEALAKAREHFEEEKQALRVQLETVHKQELDAARSYPSTVVRESIEKNKEIIKYTSEIDELKLKIKNLIEREDKLNITIKKLQQLLDKAEKDLADADARHAVDIEKLDKQLKALLKDYSDLMDVKVTLDMEISTYRKLLQAEECRLHLTPSPKSGKVRSALSFGEGEAPSRKRQRVMEESFITETNSHVSIEEVSIEQEYVAVSNMTDKDQSLRGWVLSKKGEDDDTLDYKFPAKTTIGPGQTVKIYSSGAGASQNPPHSLVFKKLDAWQSPQGIEIQLKNKDGDVVSSYKAKAESCTQYVEEEDQRACKLM